MSLFWRYFVIFSLLGNQINADDLEPEYAEAREGSDAELPCNLQPVHPPDKVNFVAWNKGNDDLVLYKYDLRGVRGQHWADPSVSDRYFFRLLDEERALLTVSLTRLSDEAIYHCRVDFNRSPTRYTHVNLTVVGEYLTAGNFLLFITDNCISIF
ncbi:hypothetical protein RI129_003163 [Pyrocoelia pectoralis]|uniref:Ig-like domain-containing protein n=1 Tax=Pyrocoelia pectoralis TaxID=417401 RepID=A0AAN7VPN7_9COLE